MFQNMTIYSKFCGEWLQVKIVLCRWKRIWGLKPSRCGLTGKSTKLPRRWIQLHQSPSVFYGNQLWGGYDRAWIMNYWILMWVRCFRVVQNFSKYWNCFVQKEWSGIQRFPPLELQVKEDFPPVNKVLSRPINPRLYEHAKKEIDRLTQFLYPYSTSPWASPLVLAPNETKLIIRFCSNCISYYRLSRVYLAFNTK